MARLSTLLLYFSFSYLIFHFSMDFTQYLEEKQYMRKDVVYLYFQASQLVKWLYSRFKCSTKLLLFHYELKIILPQFQFPRGGN